MLRSPLQKLSLNLTRGRLCTLPALCAAQRFGCKMENGQRIYTSDYPSVMEEINAETTLYDYALKMMKSADPKKPAMIQAETGEQYTYPELMQVIERTAAVFYHQTGVRAGDCVCVAMLNHIHFAPVVYGTLRLGAIVSTVNPMGDSATYAYHLKENGAHTLVTQRYFQKVAEGAVDLVLRETNRKVTILYAEDIVKKTDVAPIPEDYQPLKNAKPDDTVFIPFSSGTTGLPKGVQLTNRNLYSNAIQSKGTLRSDDSNYGTDVAINVLPFFHIYGFTCCLNGIIMTGSTQIVMTKFNLASYIELIAKYKATIVRVAPPILIALIKNMEHFKDKDISSLRTLTSGAAPLDADTAIAASALLKGCAVGQGYGMTEMSPVVTTPPFYPDMTYTPGSNGQPLPDTEIRIVKVDADQQSGADKSRGIDAEEGGEGEIWTRGPQMMKGYLKKEDTDKCMQDGWYRTGDIGCFDTKTNELRITDRLKELIKYKGFQVSPAQLEGVLLQHPWVNDCIVVGVTDPRDVSFEVPRALVVLKAGLPNEDVIRASDEIYRYVMRRCPPEKRLHGGVRIVESIPKNASGKLLRRQARQEEQEYMKKNFAEAA